MPLRIYNTLTRKKEELVPLHPGEARLYVCGVTVYDLSHVGHARSAIVFDVIRRYLRFKGYQVRFVKNFTDVDDKIIKRAQEEGVPSRELAERYIAEHRKDMAALAVEAADHEPKATEHVPEMIRLIERLLAQGFAYRVNGDVYFEVRRFAAYGKLSGKNPDDLRAGARVEVDERKRDPLDFALWKNSKPDEPAWESPWGPGRPGWHIECSAMSMHYLGESFDIHGGGEDLIFPHHENEIAQSEAATGKPFVRYWIHNGFVRLGEEKMSKSLGNILTVKELVRRHDPEALRLYLLGTHYRNPLEFSEERVRDSARALERFRALIDEADRLAPRGPGSRYGSGGLRPGRRDAMLAAINDPALVRQLQPCVERFEQAMDDDFNTPAALGALFDLSHELHRYRDSLVGAGQVKSFLSAVDVLLELGGALGLLEQPAKPSGPSPELRAWIERLILERDDARKRRDWNRADELRTALQNLGATIEDTPDGTRWKWNP